MTALLTIKQLSITLQDKQVLSTLDLTLNEGDILGLVGASGCGKTTLLNAIAGFNKLSSGTIAIEDNVLSDSRACVPAEKRQVGMIFQDYALFPHLTVKENIAFGINKLPKDVQNKQINQLLSIFKLNDYSESYIHQLSGGQQQRVAIARALAPKPKLLLLDEPFSNIDARLRNELMLEIRLLLKQFKTTAIFVTHNKDEVFTFADKMAVMAEGRLLQIDSPANICQQPNSFQVADFLQLGSWLPCSVNLNEANNLLGKISITNADNNLAGIMQLLVKPSQLFLSDIEDETNIANAQVEYMSVTEQGFHYYLSSLDDLNAEQLSSAKLSSDKPSSNKINLNKSLAFAKLSVYSDLALPLKQKVSVKVKPHNYLFFNKPSAISG